MTSFAVSSGGIEYFDQKTGGSVNATLDTYTISNGSTFVVRTDTYACANHSSAFGSLDNVQYSGTGGELKIDPTYVRVIKYSGGSGNSPAFGAAISQGGVSGVFLGAWSSWQSDPVAPGAAIPASGYIKVGGVTGGSFSAGALTGISANALSADVQGWIEVRGAETATVTVPRVGKFTTVEAWFYLDDTTGVAGQIIPCPTTGAVAQRWPGVWIETSPGSGVYERYIGAGAQAPLSTTPTDDRAKFVWQTTSGLRLGSDGTNTVGYVPPAGCKVRIPAIILTNCTRTAGSGSGPCVVPNATLGNRQEFVTTSGGYINIAGAVIEWYANFSQAFYLKISKCAISTTLAFNKVTSAIVLSDIVISCAQSQVATTLNCQFNTAGCDISNLDAARFSVSVSGDSCVNVQNCRGVTLTNVSARLLTMRTFASANAFNVSSSRQVVATNCLSICARFNINIVDESSFVSCKYIDSYVATTSGSAVNAFACATLSNSVISDLKFPYLNSPCYNAAVQLVACNKVTIRNIGSYASPVDFNNICAYVLDIGTSTTDTKVQRCYAVNTRSGFDFTDNSVDGVVFENCSGDYSDSSALLSLNTLVKNVAHTSTATGQTAVYGSHWRTRFTSLVDGVIEVMCNEPTDKSALQCVVVSGSPLFSSGGSVLMTVVGQQIIWEMPFFAIGITALANIALGLIGTNTGNLTYEFQYNLGSGYNGTWLTASAANFVAVGAIDPAVGIKIKLRVTCVTANASNVLTNIRIQTVTTSTAQSANLYPLDQITLTLTGLPTGCDVVVLSAGTATILAAVDAIASTSYSYSYETPVSVDIGIIKAGYKPFYIRNYTLQSSNVSLPIALTLDRDYQP